MWRGLACLACVLSLACGGKTAPKIGPPPPDAAVADAATDSGVDAGPDAGDPDLFVDCGRREAFTSPRRPIELVATVRSEAPLVFDGWSIAATPPGSAALAEPASGPTTVLVPDLAGDYLMVYEARDAAGNVGGCEVTVHAVVGPPVAICPEGEITAFEGETVLVEGDGFDDERVVGFFWEVVEAPAGAMAFVDPPDAPATTFFGDRAGTYRLRLTVVDEDMATGSCEATVRIIGPPIVTCPGEVILAPTRQPVTIRARSRDDAGIARRRWEVVRRPIDSMAEPSPVDADVTTFTPDRQGDYLLRFTATDRDGLSSSCEVQVIGTPTPPDLMCPATVDTNPLTPTELVADAVDDGIIVSYRWRLIDSPMGSAAGNPTPQAMRTTFRPDIAGIYTIQLTVTDDDGDSATCLIEVRALATEGLRIEMSWDTDNTDIDLHLLNPMATSWTNGNDCHFRNCVGGLSWGAPGPDDDPSLDIDDTDGFGPENINIDLPQSGDYRIGVHVWDGRVGGRPRTTSGVTVNVYCGGSTTTPRQTFGPVDLTGGSDESANDFWRVADVTIDAFGDCTITDLADAAGNPNIQTAGPAFGSR